jgi:hypothetical protein
MREQLYSFIRRTLQRSVSETETQEEFAQLAALKLLVGQVTHLSTITKGAAFCRHEGSQSGNAGLRVLEQGRCVMAEDAGGAGFHCHSCLQGSGERACLKQRGIGMKEQGAGMGESPSVSKISHSESCEDVCRGMMVSFGHELRSLRYLCMHVFTCKKGHERWSLIGDIKHT